MIINGIDYDKREADLRAQNIDPFGTDDTVFGDEVYCNQHCRVHGTGWCTVDNMEKWWA